MPFRPIRRALLSVHDKTGLVELGRAPARPKASSWSRPAAPPRPCATAERAGGRGQRAHRRARDPGRPGQDAAPGRPWRHPRPPRRCRSTWRPWRSTASPPIDLVVVNLYPFEATLASGADFAACIEQIDVGGPAMIRAAAKNHDGVAVVVEPADYRALLTAVEAGGTEVALAAPARRQGVRAHRRLRRRDRRLARARDRRGVPRARDPVRHPPQPPALRREPASARRLLCRRRRAHRASPRASQLQGKELSFNNLNDTDAALALVAELAEPAVAIIKHANPCGVAVGADLARGLPQGAGLRPAERLRRHRRLQPAARRRGRARDRRASSPRW